MQKVEIDGKEVEVYLASEVTERETAAKAAVEAEWKPKVDDLTTKYEKAVADGRSKSKSIADFKELTDSQYAKLDEVQKTLYDNQKLIADQGKVISEIDQKTYESAVAAGIARVVGADKATQEKVKAMYDAINLEDDTPEKIETRARAALGALGGSQPDLLSSLGFVGGGWQSKPNETKAKEGDTFADTDAGRAAARELGLKIEYTEAEKKALGIT